MFKENEIKALRYIIQKELKKFEAKESEVRDQPLDFLEAEEKYDELLKGILNKL